MRSTINICNCGECILFCFLLFLVSTGSGLPACSFVSSFVTCFSGWILFWNYTKHMWVNFDPSGVSCCLCSKWCYHFVLASPSLLPFLGNKSKKLYTVGKRTKKCVREMTVEAGFFSGHPGCYLVSLRAFPYNRYDAVCSFLLSMLLAPAIVRLTVGFWQWFYEVVLCVVGFNFFVPGPETTGTTRLSGRNLVY